jgi:hypothetical protein
MDIFNRGIFLITQTCILEQNDTREILRREGRRNVFHSLPL